MDGFLLIQEEGLRDSFPLPPLVIGRSLFIMITIMSATLSDHDFAVANLVHQPVFSMGYPSMSERAFPLPDSSC